MTFSTLRSASAIRWLFGACWVTIQVQAASESIPEIRVINAETFEADDLARRCLSEVRKVPKVGFLQVVFRATGPPPPKHAHIEYSDWLTTRSRFLETLTGEAECTSVNGNTVLRIRQVDGQIARMVLAGTDPLMVRIDDRSYEIIHVALNPRSSFIVPRADLYVVSSNDGEMRQDDGLFLLKRFETHLSSREVSVHFRQDPFFVYDPKFPYISPFEAQDVVPPTESEYAQRPTMRCRQGMCQISNQPK